MRTLFPLATPSTAEIPGLSYLPDYISEREEAELVAAIDALAWDTSWDRRRQPYGRSYDQTGRSPKPIPPWAEQLVERMYREGLSERRFDQVLVNEYLPGQGIALYRDYLPFDRTVASLSLLSPVVMDFRHASEDQRAAILLQRCSLLILSDEARYDWQHGIARRKNDRWQGCTIPRSRRLSITFRTHRDRRAAAPR